MDWSSLQNRIGRSLNRYRYFLLVFLLGLLLLLIPAKQPTAPVRETAQERTIGLAEELETLLSNLEGAGKVRVLLTQAKGEQVLYQSNETDSGSDGSYNTRSETVILSDGSRSQQGLIRQVIPPTYLGAVVLCQGANSPQVRLAIVEAVGNATGLPSNKISVLKLK